MVWALIAVLALAALAPLGTALRGRTAARGAKEQAVAFHQAQLTELDRDRAEGRILPVEHATAVLEVQRRLLAAADAPEQVAHAGSRAPVLVVAALVPLAALGLYLVSGRPGLPSVTPLSADVQVSRMQQDAALMRQLRERLAALPPGTEQARQGYVLLGDIEEGRGDFAAAAAAWRTALSTRFDAVLAVRAAAAAERAEGGLSPTGVALLKRALAAAPADAPWRGAVEAHLKQVAP